MKLKSISLLFVAGGLLVQTACANRLLHPQLKENPSVMRRSWTLGTRSIFGESGDRGYEFSNSVQFENTLIFGSRESGVVSIYPKLKSIRWRFRVEGGVESEIAVEQGLVYFGGGDGFFYAINANTGRLEWKIEIRTQHVSRPTVVNNRVLFTSSDDTIYAHDAKTGKWLWHYKRKSGQMATIRTASTPTVIGNQVLAGLSDGYLVAIGFEDGQLQWERKLNQASKFMDVDATPVIDRDQIFISSYDGALYCLKRADGSVIWKFEGGGPRRALVEESRVVFPSSDGNVYALDKASGKLLWKFELDAGIPTEIAETPKTFVFGSSKEFLYAIDRATGEPLYRMSSGWGSGFMSAPVYHAELKKIFALSQSGNLYSFYVR